MKEFFVIYSFNMTNLPPKGSSTRLLHLLSSLEWIKARFPDVVRGVMAIIVFVGSWCYHEALPHTLAEST